MIVGGPLERIGSPSSSSSVPSAETEPVASSTPSTDRTRSSVSAGIVGGAAKSSSTARRACTETSVPFCTRSNRSLNEASIVSVNTNVSATKATPMTTAKPVSAVRSLRAMRPFSATLSNGLHHGLHQVEHALHALSLPVVHDLAVVEHHDPVGHRGGVRVVGDHHHGLAELVHGLAEQPQHLVGRVRVEVAGRLVGEHHRGAVDQRTGDGDALLLAARKLGRAV